MTDSLYNFMEYVLDVGKHVIFFFYVYLHCLSVATNTDTTVNMCLSSDL